MVPDEVFGRQNLIRFSLGTQTGRQLHCRSKQIVIVLNRFTCAETDPQMQRSLGVAPLNEARAF
jgi:hypothetical protein